MDNRGRAAAERCAVADASLRHRGQIILSLQSLVPTTLETHKGWSGASMKRLLQAAVLGIARRISATLLLAAFAGLALAAGSASAQTAFTLPAPPFELPLVPSISGSWTATIGLGAEYRPDFEGAKRSMLSPIP